MSHDIQVKIAVCGPDVAATASAGASYVGFVFFLNLRAMFRFKRLQRWRWTLMPMGVAKSLVVNADDALVQRTGLTAVVPLDMLRITWLRSRGRRKGAVRVAVMKAVRLLSASDLAQIDDYAAVADQLLIVETAKNTDLPVAMVWRLTERWLGANTGRCRGCWQVA
jgi:phosphoribosylanthranilate isomerase